MMGIKNYMFRSFKKANKMGQTVQFQSQRSNNKISSALWKMYGETFYSCKTFQHQLLAYLYSLISTFQGFVFHCLASMIHILLHNAYLASFSGFPLCFNTFFKDTLDNLLDFSNPKVLYELLHEKTCFCVCENKDADQLCGNHEADQCLCFRYTGSTIPLLLKSQISSF